MSRQVPEPSDNMRLSPRARDELARQVARFKSELLRRGDAMARALDADSVSSSDVRHAADHLLTGRTRRAQGRVGDVLIAVAAERVLASIVSQQSASPAELAFLSGLVVLGLWLESRGR